MTLDGEFLASGSPVDEFPHVRLAPFTSWDSRLSRE